MIPASLFSISLAWFALTVVPAAYFAGLALGLGEGRPARRAAGGALVLGLMVWSVLGLPATARMLRSYPPLGSFLCPAVERYDSPGLEAWAKVNCPELLDDPDSL